MSVMEYGEMEHLSKRIASVMIITSSIDRPYVLYRDDNIMGLSTLVARILLVLEKRNLTTRPTDSSLRTTTEVYAN